MEKMSKSMKSAKSSKKAKEHMNQLERLQEKDPEFYKYLKEHEKELLEFNDEDIGEEGMVSCNQNIDGNGDGGDINHADTSSAIDKEYRSSVNALTPAMVDSWCDSVMNGSLGAVRSILRAFRMACHCGDDGDDSFKITSSMSSGVFNKVMLFVLSEMDGILRELLRFSSSNANKTITELTVTSQWRKYNYLVKSYLGNALHILNQMTDSEMISFTLRRLRYSCIFFAAFPSLLRKYIKVVLHFWGTGEGALPVVSLLFLRELCIQMGSKCIEECFKGMYRAYIMNCQFVNAVKLQRIEFLRNCVIELFAVDFQSAYQHAFVFIRQLANILRDALNTKTKEAFRKVYEWKFINSLELWTGVVCAYASQADLRLLVYPLSQIITGVARLVPTARYFPLRLRCIRMLDRIGASTGSFVPVSTLLLEMLEMKELKKPPAGGVGKALDLRVLLKVTKPTVKTRAYQDACVSAVVEELAEHLVLWNNSVAFVELSFIPVIRLRSFCKTTKVERFRRQVKELLYQVSKKQGTSLQKFVEDLREGAEQRRKSLLGSSVVVGADSAVFTNKVVLDNEDNTGNANGSAVFSSPWLPKASSKLKKENSEDKKPKRKKDKNISDEDDGAVYEDVVEDLVLSSEDDELSVPSENGYKHPKQQQIKKRKRRRARVATM